MLGGALVLNRFAERGSRSNRASTPKPSPSGKSPTYPSQLSRSSEPAPYGTTRTRRGTRSSAAGLSSRYTATGRLNPGEYLWESWSPLMGRLPVDLRGPVSETAEVLPREGQPRLHEEGRPILPEPSYLDDENLNWESGTFLADSAALPWPSFISTPARDPEGASTGQPAGSSTSTENIEGSNSSGAAVVAPVLTEALNPTPPHLRPHSTHPKPRAARQVRSPGESSRSIHCANCRKAVRDPKVWRRCRDCHHQLCSHCIVEALLAYEEGWCTHCAGLRHLDSISKELVPQTEAVTPEISPITAPLVSSPSVTGGLGSPEPSTGPKELDRPQQPRIPRENGSAPANSVGQTGRRSTGGFAAALLREFGGDSTPQPEFPASNATAI
jgi:hypothetical protein